LPLAQWQCQHYPTRGEFSPSGKLLVIVVAERRGEGPSTVELRSAADGQLVQPVELPGTTLWDATFLDEQTLLLACEDGRLSKWRIDEGRELVAIATGNPSRAGHPVKRVVVAPSQRVAATLALDGELRIWDAVTLAPVAQSAPVLASDDVLALAPHRPWIARVAGDASEPSPLHGGMASIEERSLTIVDFRQNREIHRLGGHKDMITVAAFNADGSRLATGDSNGNVIVWDTITGHELLTFPAHINQAMALSFAPDDRSLASGGSDLVLRIWQGARERLGARD
jgi:WD40 repeat protein